MKRKLTIILTIIAIILMSATVTVRIGLATEPTPCEPSTTLVCGNTMSSISGYGAVEICGNCYECGIADGVCPEDFYSQTNNLQASCANCPDPDCTASIYGHVTDSTTGGDAIDAVIYAQYPSWLGGQTEIASANLDGNYNASGILTGTTTFYAKLYKPDNSIFSDIQTKTLHRGDATEINFSVKPAECQPDCTRGQISVCDESCNGINGCSFPAIAPYTSNEVATMMNGANTNPAERVNILEEKNATAITFTYLLACTDGPHEEIRQNRTITLVNSTGNNEGVEDLATYVQRVLYNGELVSLTAHVYTKD